MGFYSWLRILSLEGEDLAWLLDQTVGSMAVSENPPTVAEEYAIFFQDNFKLRRRDCRHSWH
jgi:hypothetical protein